MNIQYRPLPAIWPSGTRTQYRKRAHFRVDWTRAINHLERELRLVGVGYNSTIVIEAGYSEADIRVDGRPRANARLLDPAVVISFESKFGPLRYGCDTYDDHLANIRAIALALEALRAVDRYGVTKRGEQYQGWKALPATSLSYNEALDFLASVTGIKPTPAVPGHLAAVYRAAAKRLHPDVGGTREEWARLERAKEALSL